MRFSSLVAICGLGLLASSCGSSAVNCSDEDARSALETAIREGLERTSLAQAKGPDGEALVSSSAVRAAVAKIKLVIDDVRTTKEDPESTKRFCTGSLKIVFSTEIFTSADRSRELAGLTDVAEMADAAGIDKGADYLKGDLDYSVQPTDDGEKVFAEFENADAKLDVFGEVIAASLLTSKLEAQNRAMVEEAAQQKHAEESALNEQLAANLDAANVMRKTADEAINTIWQAIDADTRRQLLAQQRAWIKQKEATCRVQGLQASTEPREQKAADYTCQAQLTQQRASELQGYLGYE